MKKESIEGSVDLGVNTRINEDKLGHHYSIQKTMKIDILGKLKLKQALPLMENARIVELIRLLKENLGVRLRIQTEQVKNSLEMISLCLQQLE